LVRETEVLLESTISFRLLQRSQTFSLKILHKREDQHLLVGHVTNEDRDIRPTEAGGRSEPALSRHELVAVTVGTGPNQKGLQ